MGNDAERELSGALEQMENHYATGGMISEAQCRTIIDTLKRQIPQHPVSLCKDQDGRDFGRCPRCGHKVTSALDHCAYDPCLQRLTWKRKA